MKDLIRVSPIMDATVRGLCCKAYDLHPRGCPNFGQRPTCPPAARLFSDVYDMAKPVWAVINEFDLGGHVERLKIAHPNWSDRQLRCVLYWQGGARAKLALKIKMALATLPRFRSETCPEAMGVNVTATLASEGITLEWPPVHIARQVALIAVPVKKFGCHIPFEEDGVVSDDCVLETGGRCILAKPGMKKEECQYWKEIEEGK